MTLTRSFIRNAPMTPLDARLMNMAQVVCNADGSPRVGVLGAHNRSIVSTTATMNVAVAAAEFVTSKGKADGAAIFTNDGTVNVAIGAAPASNSRIDVIWVKHNDDTTGDANALPVFGVTAGVAAGSPTKPAIPTGALELATLRIYAGTTATNGGSNVLTNTYQMTAMRGGVVGFRKMADLAAWTTAVEGQQARVYDETDVRLNRDEVFYRGYWCASLQYAQLVKTAAHSTSATSAQWDPLPWSLNTMADDGMYAISPNPERIRLTQPGHYRVDAVVRAAATIYARVGLNGNHIQASEQSGAYCTPQYIVECSNPASDYVGLFLAQFTGAAVALVNGYTSMRVQYLG